MKRFLLSMVITLFLAQPALAAPKGSIAAVVNDSAITKTEVRDRAVLYISSGGQKPTDEQIGKIEGQVLDKLIDETLQIQQAQKLGITIGDAEVEAAFADIARQNNLDADTFKKRIRAGGATVDTLFAQIRADLAWGQVVRHTLRPQVNVSESDIDLTLRQLEGGSGKAQYLVAEIFLAVPDPAQENDIRQAMADLAKRLAQGEPFSGLARQYSQAPGARTGGDLGWMQEGSLDPALDAALAKMQPGQITPPIRTDKGYHLLFLRDRRHVAGVGVDQLVTLKQILIPLTQKDTQATLAAKLGRLEKLRATVKTCDDFAAQMANFKSSGTTDMGQRRLSTLPDQTREIVARLDVGQISAPFRAGAGAAVIMLCARDDAPADAEAAIDPAREQIATKLGMQRLDQMALRLLRDLRETAFIDKRI